jgi:hypothetical protein
LFHHLPTQQSVVQKRPQKRRTKLNAYSLKRFPAGWRGCYGARLNKEINAAFADPAMKARLIDTGGSMLPGSAADFGRLMAEETEKWAKVTRRPVPGSEAPSTGAVVEL